MKHIRIRKTSERKPWGCPRTKNRSNWCHAWCDPQEGIGDCGRVAPHSLTGRTQQAIANHLARKATE